MKEGGEIYPIVRRRYWMRQKMICLDHYMETASQVAT